MKRLVPRKKIAPLILLLLTDLACDQKQEEPQPGSAQETKEEAKSAASQELVVKASDEERALAEQLLVRLKAGHALGASERRAVRNLVPFLVLASTSHDDFVVSQSLLGLSDVLNRGVQPPPEVDKIVMAHLKTTSAQVRGSALRAAHARLLSQPSAEMSAALVSILSKAEDAPTRLAVLSALHGVSPSVLGDELFVMAKERWDAPGVDAFEKLLWLDLALSTPRGVHRFTVPVHLLEASEPRVVGLAAAALGRQRKPETLSQLLALLKHELPLVRFFGARGLGELGTQEALPELSSLLADKAEVAAKRTGPQGLDGRVIEWESSLCPQGARVQHAALWAIEELAGLARGRSSASAVGLGGDWPARLDTAKRWLREQKRGGTPSANPAPSAR